MSTDDRLVGDVVPAGLKVPARGRMKDDGVPARFEGESVDSCVTECDVSSRSGGVDTWEQEYGEKARLAASRGTRRAKSSSWTALSVASPE